MYAPSWFLIKEDEKFENQLSICFKQPDDFKEPAHNSFTFSTWGLEPEKMLYCMVVVEELEPWEKGLRVIIDIRKKLSEEEKKVEVSEGMKKGKGG